MTKKLDSGHVGHFETSLKTEIVQFLVGEVERFQEFDCIQVMVGNPSN